MQLERALLALERRHAVRARKAMRELRDLLKSTARPRKKSVTIRLWDRHIQAAKLLSDIHGGSYQERIRTWIELAVEAEAHRLGIKKPAPNHR